MIPQDSRSKGVIKSRFLYIDVGKPLWWAREGMLSDALQPNFLYIMETFQGLLPWTLQALVQLNDLECGIRCQGQFDNFSFPISSLCCRTLHTFWAICLLKSILLFVLYSKKTPFKSQWANNQEILISRCLEPRILYGAISPAYKNPWGILFI